MFVHTIPIGSFTFQIKTDIKVVSDEITKLYADYSCPKNDDFTDFQLEIKSASGIRKWFKPQVNFYFDEFKPFKPLPKPQAYPMLEWGMNWCIANHAHHYLILHAACIEKNGQAIVLPAEQGSGKSTLSAAMMLKGWRLLSDELALISLATSQVYPCTRPINLKNDSINIIGDTFKDTQFSESVHDTNKGTVALLKPSTKSVEKAKIPAVIHSIVFPKYIKDTSALINEISEVNAFEKIINNSFNYDVLGEEAFEFVAKLLRGTPCYEFQYSSFDDAEQILSGLING